MLLRIYLAILPGRGEAAVPGVAKKAVFLCSTADCPGGGIIRVAEGKGHARRIPTAIQQWVSGRAFGDWAGWPKLRA